MPVAFFLRWIDEMFVSVCFFVKEMQNILPRDVDQLIIVFFCLIFIFLETGFFIIIKEKRTI